MTKIRTYCLAIALVHQCLLMNAAFAKEPKPAQTAKATEVQGEAFAYPGARRLALLATVSAGEQIHLTSSAKVTLSFLEKYVVFVISGEGEFKVTDAEVVAVGTAAKPVKQEFASVFTTVKLRSNSLTQAGIVLRNALQDSGELRPANELVACAAVSFGWTAFGRGEYTLNIKDEIDTLVHRAAVSPTAYRLPDAVKLLPGTKYRWDVSAQGPQKKPISKWAEFSCLTTDEVQQIAALRPVESSSLSDHLTYALFLESARINSLAKTAWQDVALRFPGIELEAAARR